ncbi:RagB/SusD family nutrient uptake outer membrane protein [Dyadobacter frigoris]|nr:RagB/SusD family nutrient uptake outer membrane protein [Dyadobacter frigoris]
MKQINITLKPFVYLICLCVLMSCENEFLDVRPDKALVVPQTLDDFQAILDNTSVMNVAPGLNEVSADDFLATEAAWGVLSEVEKNCYIWQPDLFGSQPSVEWNYPYQQVFYANIVLNGLSALKPDMAQISRWQNLHGSALFYRAIAFYHLVQIFASPYGSGDQASQPGIPLRLDQGIEKKSTRSSLKESYDQIEKDLLMAVELLPERTNYKSRPSKAAAFALLSRLYLTMGNFEKSLVYADSSLKINSQLMDYSLLDSTSLSPFPSALPNGNVEVLFHTAKTPYLFETIPTVVVDPLVFSSFAHEDLRRVLFFNNRGNGIITFKGSYNSFNNGFAGLATDEIYLIRAECFTRSGKIAEAQDDLNFLLASRWKKGSFTPVKEDSQDALLLRIINERRKELVGRGLRWTDLRRLNLDARFAKTHTRRIGGHTSSLSPNDVKYVFPIPDNEILMNGLQQNPRE